MYIYFGYGDLSTYTPKLEIIKNIKGLHIEMLNGKNHYKIEWQTKNRKIFNVDDCV